MIAKLLRHLSAVLAVVVLNAPTVAQEPRVEFDGVEIFCHILKHFKLEPIESIEQLPNYKPEETLIVVFGAMEPLDTILKLAPNLDSHALLVASDRNSDRLQMRDDGIWGWKKVGTKLAPWQLRIPGSEVLAENEGAYQNKTRCPLLSGRQLSRNHPIFRDIEQGLATNAPSYLETDESDLHLLARFPPGARSIGMNDINQRGESVGYIFGAPAESPRRVLFLAGHGVFMNGMLVQSDCDNGLFAVNTVRWLRQGPSGSRKYALMIHNSEVITNFNLPLTGPPPVPLPPTTVVNRMLRQMENERIFHRILEEVVGWRNIMRFILIAGTLGLFLYGVARLFPARHRQEAVPLVVGMQPPQPPGRPLLQRRQLELLTQDNLWESAHALARQWFLDHAGVAVPLWDEADSVSPPDAKYHAGWWARQKLAGQVRAVWAFAIADPSERVSLAEFRKLTETLQALGHAVHSGQLTFAGGKSSAG